MIYEMLKNLSFFPLSSSHSLLLPAQPYIFSTLFLSLVYHLLTLTESQSQFLGGKWFGKKFPWSQIHFFQNLSTRLSWWDPRDTPILKSNLRQANHVAENLGRLSQQQLGGPSLLSEKHRNTGTCKRRNWF